MSAAKKHIAWLWLVTLLVSTVGVHVHKIYCYCIGESSVSLFAAVDPCVFGKKPAAQADCCKKDMPTCCEKAAEKGHSKDGCMKKTSRFFQLKTEFTTHKIEAQNFDFQWVAEVAALVWFEPSFRAALFEAPTFNKAPPPPPRSGRMIRQQIQSFRC
jgi:hypothetical protein